MQISSIGSTLGAICEPNHMKYTLRIILFLTLSSYAGRVTAKDSQDFLLECNESFIGEMKRDTLPPALIARNLAIMHAAIHLAFRGPLSPSDAQLALISFKVGSCLLPAHLASLEENLNHYYPTRVPDADREFADSCAAPVLEYFKDDGASSHVTYTARGTPGAWARTAPFFRAPELPHWPKVRPVLLESAAQFRPKGPPKLASQQYAKALREVANLGSVDSTSRTPEQGAIAQFWSDFSYTETPVGHWNSIARDLIRQKKLSQADTAKLFGQLNTAMADAAIACWDAKYTFDFWRPITAVARASEDDNPNTQPEPKWEPFLKTPSHPEYVSGHSSFSGASCFVLSTFFGTDKIHFTVRSDTLKGVTRNFDSIEACAKECGTSRIYGGIHYRFSCDDGLELGKRVGSWTVENYDKLQERILAQSQASQRN